MSRNYWEWEPVLQINPEKSALLVIDMQKGFLEEGLPLAVTMAREQVLVTSSLIDCYHKHKLPVIFTVYEFCADNCYDFYWKMAQQRGLDLSGERHAFSPGSYETMMADEFKISPDDYVIKKCGYDAFAETSLQQVLDNRGVTDLVITGTVVNWCVDSTVRAAYHHRYKIFVVADAVSGYDQAGISGQEWCRLELNLFAEAFGAVITAQQLITAIDDPKLYVK